MARALGAAGSDTEGWFLSLSSPSPATILRLREGGFYAGRSSVGELQSSLTEAERAREMELDDDIVDSVEEFELFDDDLTAVPLFRLPFECGRAEKIWLRGKTGDDLRVMKIVQAWSVKFGPDRPQLFVKNIQDRWIKLGKQAKAYEAKFLSAFVLLDLLEFARKNLDASETVIWNHLRAVYSYHDSLPTLDELLENLYVLERLVTRDTELGASDYVQSLLRRKRKAMHDEETSCKRQKSEPEEVDEDEVGESICAICDDGGDLLCCDGPCLRSFHGFKMEGVSCRTLCLSEAEVKHTAKFFCKNCELNQHQCFSCGKLGSSSGASQEVFLCDVALCGKFYHLSCVSKLLGGRAIKTGFTCPLHNCFKCHEREKEEESLWLYPCRRCPRAWHEACAGVNFEDGDEDRRGWIISQSRFLYCMNHTLDPVLRTPKRNHLKFPEICQPSKERGKKAATSFQSSKGVKFLEQRQGNTVSSSDGPAIFSQKEVEDTVTKIMSSCKLTFETITAQLTTPSTARPNSNRSRHLNRIKSLLNAFQKASMFLQCGGSIEEAQLIFPPKDLKLLESAKDALRVYLSPMLFGMRYSSFGRHFTRTFKLESIVDRLSWYVNAGDMVVDLCCGSNEFSRLMSDKLEAMRKNCRYKNFDFIQPSDTFHFERKDYMEIKPDELCPGDKLIMGLNPPFGTKGQLASMFVEHCVKFQPKIIVLIAPEETRRPDGRYVLTWEDKDLLKGEAFYLPGSVDADGRTIKQENIFPPVLYLWSRVDFAEAHSKIAMERGHLRSSVADAKSAANIDVGGALQLSATRKNTQDGALERPLVPEKLKVQVPGLHDLVCLEPGTEKEEVPSVESRVKDNGSPETGEMSPASSPLDSNQASTSPGKKSTVQLLPGDEQTSSRQRKKMVRKTRQVVTSPPARPPPQYGYLNCFGQGVYHYQHGSLAFRPPPFPGREVYFGDHYSYIREGEPHYQHHHQAERPYPRQPAFHHNNGMNYYHYPPPQQHHLPGPPCFYHPRPPVFQAPEPSYRQGGPPRYWR